MTIEQITQLIQKLQSLSVFDDTEACRFLPNSDVDRPYRETLTSISSEDYKKVPHNIRFDFCFVTLTEYFKSNGCRYSIRRDISGSYLILCYADGIHYDTIVMDTYHDTEVLINHLPKPHHSVLNKIKKSFQ